MPNRIESNAKSNGESTMKSLFLVVSLLVSNALFAQETTNPDTCLDILRGKSELTCNLSKLEETDKASAKALTIVGIVKVTSELGTENPLKSFDAKKPICFNSVGFFNCKGAK